MWRLLDGEGEEVRSLYRVDKYKVRFAVVSFAVLVLNQTIDLVLDILGT